MSEIDNYSKISLKISFSSRFLDYLNCFLRSDIDTSIMDDEVIHFNNLAFQTMVLVLSKYF